MTNIWIGLSLLPYILKWREYHNFGRATTALVHRFLLGGVDFREFVFQVMSWWWMY
jgi:hypothetical protein